MTFLRLGRVDKGQLPKNVEAFLAPYHLSMSPALKEKLKFRDEGTGKWRPFQEIEGSAIQALQQFLKDAGFMPKANVDGVFGYATVAAVRLFQEYIRTVEGDTGIGTPDGIVGPNTFRYIEKWKAEKTGTDQFVCDWGKANVENPSEAYKHWFSLLQKGKTHYQDKPNEILQHLEAYPNKTDTKKIKDWNTNTDTIHLFGIRRNQEQSYVNRRGNDDLFVLLIKGMAFYFYGSTDPNPGITARKDIPFLIEGQHEYGFGWHKVNSYNKIYQALRPANHGVLVFRDSNGNQALDAADLVKGLDAQPNQTINIHWSGIGTTNFSAGCQVIAGLSYINHKGALINCKAHAATSYSELGKKTRGAYNVLADLILSYAPLGVRTLIYTLAQDGIAFLSDKVTEEMGAEMLQRLKAGDDNK